MSREGLNRIKTIFRETRDNPRESFREAIKVFDTLTEKEKERARPYMEGISNLFGQAE